jgi:hypothetical protein
MQGAGFSEADVQRVVFENPIAFFAQSGKLSRADLDDRHVDQSQLFEGNSVLRGQTPQRG